MDERGRDDSTRLPEDLAGDPRVRGAIEKAAEEGLEFPLTAYVDGSRVVVGKARLEKRGEAGDIYVTSLVDHPLVEEVLGASPSQYSLLDPPLKLSEFQKIYAPRELSEEERIAKWYESGGA